MPDDTKNNESNESTAEATVKEAAEAETAVKEASEEAAAAEAEVKEAEVKEAEAKEAEAKQAEANEAEAKKAGAAEPAKKASDGAGGPDSVDEGTTETGKGDAKKTDAANGAGNATAAQTRPCTEREKIFTWLTVGQYSVLGLIGVIIVILLFNGLLGNNTGPFLFALSKPEVARGVITFLVAAGTVSLAVLLVMAAIMSSGSKDLENRFAFGKEVLTLLIGILGTIVGFYYGSAKDDVAPLTLSPVALSAPAPKIGDKFTLDAVVIGGVAPYTYSIKFNPPNIIPDVIDQPSTGPIHHEFTIPTDKGAQAGQVITFTIDVKDAKEQTFTFNKDGKQSITLQPAAAAAATASPGNP